MLEIALIALSAAGLLLSLYTTHLVSRTPRCADNASCPSVMGTRYARVLGIPNSSIAALFFAGLMALAIDRLRRGPVLPLWPALVACGLSLAMSAYLAWALFLRLKRF